MADKIELSAHYNRNVSKPRIRLMYDDDERGQHTFGLYIPGYKSPLAIIKVKSKDKKLILSIMQCRDAGRLSVWPEVSNVVRLEMERDT